MMGRRPRVAISGYYGHRNSGDNALAAVMAWGVVKYLLPGRLDIHSYEPLVLPTGLSPRYLKWKRLERLEQPLRAVLSDIHVLGGGSILHDRAGPAPLKTRLRLLRLGRLLGHRTVAIGVSLGPLRTAAGRELLSRFLEEADVVCLRDSRSLEFMRSLALARNDHIFLTMDPAVLLDRIGLPEPASLGRPPGPVVLVSPCDWHRVVLGDTKPDEVRRSRIAEALSRVCRETGATIRLLVMNGSPQIGDEVACRAIAERLPAGRVEIMDYDPNPLAAYRAVQASNVVVGMRLHSLVFAYTASVPMIPLDYHPKVRDFVERVGGDVSEVLDAHDLDPQVLADRVCRAVTQPQGHGRPLLPLAEAQASALSAFEALARTQGGRDVRQPPSEGTA